MPTSPSSQEQRISDELPAGKFSFEDDMSLLVAAASNNAVYPFEDTINTIYATYKCMKPSMKVSSNELHLRLIALVTFRKTNLAFKHSLSPIEIRKYKDGRNKLWRSLHPFFQARSHLIQCLHILAVRYNNTYAGHAFQFHAKQWKGDEDYEGDHKEKDDADFKMHFDDEKCLYIPPTKESKLNHQAEKEWQRQFQICAPDFNNALNSKREQEAIVISDEETSCKQLSPNSPIQILNHSSSSPSLSSLQFNPKSNQRSSSRRRRRGRRRKSSPSIVIEHTFESKLEPKKQKRINSKSRFENIGSDSDYTTSNYYSNNIHSVSSSSERRRRTRSQSQPQSQSQSQKHHQLHLPSTVSSSQPQHYNQSSIQPLQQPSTTFLLSNSNNHVEESVLEQYGGQLQYSNALNMETPPSLVAALLLSGDNNNNIENVVGKTTVNSSSVGVVPELEFDDDDDDDVNMKMNLNMIMNNDNND